MNVRLLTEHLEFLSLKGGCTGSSESTVVKMFEITCHGSYVRNFCLLKVKLALLKRILSPFYRLSISFVILLFWSIFDNLIST